MRIALIGDLQYRDGEDERISRAMDQVAALQPDLAVSLGDYGGYGKLGMLQGFRECAEFLNRLHCPVVPLMGNHDVEYRLDDGFDRDPAAWYREVFGRETLWSAMEAGHTLLLFICTEKQPREGFATQNALYISDEQFAFVQDQLERHRDWPTAVFCHCPLPGSGLRGVPPLHVAATDSYIDQCFQPLRWKQLMRANPQVFLWASAHFHMGHDAASISLCEGICHVSCGVVTSAARDGTAHTRILELAEGRMTLYTLDHAGEGGLRKDFSCVVGDPATAEGTFYVRSGMEIQLGKDTCTACMRAPDGKIYVSTGGRLLWEYDPELGDLTGTIVRGQEMRSVAWSDGRLWVRMADETIFSVDPQDPMRFDRLSGSLPAQRRPESSWPAANELTPVPYTEKQMADGLRLIL